MRLKPNVTLEEAKAICDELAGATSDGAARFRGACTGEFNSVSGEGGGLGPPGLARTEPRGASLRRTHKDPAWSAAQLGPAWPPWLRHLQDFGIQSIDGEESATAPVEWAFTSFTVDSEVGHHALGLVSGWACQQACSGLCSPGPAHHRPHDTSAWCPPAPQEDLTAMRRTLGDSVEYFERDRVAQVGGWVPHWVACAQQQHAAVAGAGRSPVQPARLGAACVQPASRSGPAGPPACLLAPTVPACRPSPPQVDVVRAVELPSVDAAIEAAVPWG